MSKLKLAFRAHFRFVFFGVVVGICGVMISVSGSIFSNVEPLLNGFSALMFSVVILAVEK